MNIGLICRELEFGGTERVAARLSCLLSSQGFNVHIITQFQPTPTEYKHQCVTRECVNEYGVWTVEDADRIVRKYDLQLVILNGGWNGEWQPSVFARFNKLGVRTVVILHHAFNNWLFSGANAGDFSKENLLPYIDCIVCVDKIQALWWSRQHPRVVYIPNPVTTEPVKCEGVGKDPHGIVWVGRGDDWGKRLDLAIDVFKHVREVIADATLTVVGALPRSGKVELPGVACTGYVPDTCRYVKSASVNLVTTLWEVTVPQVVLEASALGVPTVAFDIPVLRGNEEIQTGKTVVDVAQLVLKILQGHLFAIDSKSAAKKVVDRNRAVAEQWLKLLSSLVVGDDQEFFLTQLNEYRTIECYEKLIDEIQRSDGYFVRAQLPLLEKVRYWQGRWSGLKRRIGL